MSDLKDVLAYEAGYEAGKRDAAPRWVRCEEKPKLNELVPNLFYASKTILMYDGGVYVGYARSNKKDGPICWISDCIEISPTHWMPIEPPREGE